MFIHFLLNSIFKRSLKSSAVWILSFFCIVFIFMLLQLVKIIHLITIKAFTPQHLYIYLYIYLSAYLSVYLSIHPSIYLPISIPKSKNHTYIYYRKKAIAHIILKGSLHDIFYTPGNLLMSSIRI